MGCFISLSAFPCGTFSVAQIVSFSVARTKVKKYQCCADQYSVCVVVKWIEEGTEEKVLQPIPVAAGTERAEKIRQTKLHQELFLNVPANQLSSSHVGHTRRLPL